MLGEVLSPPFFPFACALALLFGLLALELIFALVGFSLVGDAGDVDIDVDVPELADLEALGLDLDLPDGADYEIPDVSDVDTEPGAADGGLLDWLGLGKVPFVIWLATVLLGFGGIGLVLQSVASWIWAPVPVAGAVGFAVAAGLWVARRFAGGFARVLPKTETSARSVRRFGGYTGVVTQGVARHGHPAEVRVTDVQGNTHYLRAEPAPSEKAIPRGSDVMILRDKRSGAFHLINLTK